MPRICLVESGCLFAANAYAKKQAARTRRAVRFFWRPQGDSVTSGANRTDAVWFRWRDSKSFESRNPTYTPGAVVLRFAQNITDAFPTARTKPGRFARRQSKLFDWRNPALTPTRAKLLARFGAAKIKTPPEGGVCILASPRGFEPLLLP
jgi:hypothetical protein